VSKDTDAGARGEPLGPIGVDVRTLSIRDTEATVFLSASIPDPDRWSGEFDAYEITEAVTAAARAVLSNGWRLVTAAHPTVAPMLLYVAAEVSGETPSRPSVVIYQSELFRDLLPEETLRFEEQGVGRVVWTEATAGESPDPENRSQSLRDMRQRMLEETQPDAAIFIGGMEGIIEESSLFGQMFANRPQYPLGRPGGAARSLAAELTGPLAATLLEGEVYPAVFRRVLGSP